MRLSPAALLLMLISPAGLSYAQVPAASPSQAQVANTSAPPAMPAVTASSLLQPALTQAQAMLSELKVDRWKKGTVRDEAEQNVQALLRDLQTNLPPLAASADAEPGSLSRAMPVIKNLDAFYDVLLRVEEASRVSAPSEQITALQQTLLDVNKARIAYDDQLQAQAASQEKQVFDLQTALRTQKETLATEQAKAAAEKAAPCKPATPARRKRRSTTTAKPSAATPPK